VSVDLRIGDCREILPTLAAGSVHCCVTSPPYWGLRDYGHADQIGLEPSLAAHLEQLVLVFREVRRVLRSDGTLWLNLGDSYASLGGGGAQGKHGARANRRHTQRGLKCRRHLPEGVKPKDLLGMPWRIALALQADGWWLRSDIIWSKPNPMPESVRDRPTKAHEYLFLLAKSERYYYDAQAIAEPVVSRDRGPARKPDGWASGPGSHHVVDHSRRERAPKDRAPRLHHESPTPTRTKRTVWTIPTTPTVESHFATFPRKLVEPCVLAGCPPGGVVLDPFAGTVTVGRVAEDLGRHSLLIEVRPEYAAFAERKTAQLGLVP
jgi:DNA modification methylase